MRIASFFAGVGGIDLGFERAGFKTVWANEIDKYAGETFKANFDCQLALKDIKEVEPNEIPEFDVLVAGFPCQAFSLAGYRKGFVMIFWCVDSSRLNYISQNLLSCVFLVTEEP